ncbi:3-hydroxyacyl-CoA dehydrogenase [Hymenobacter busanensis]|uniref:3-hydroxyacyl-CoA dehydrogenase n=1 Tax=Hymenobacter busanensis TaxID=2607656 RepID=A0A7L4ZYU6_9BACT|nr:3-hydroxyacyl-CoA dehydrogenase family protein [Hymenobacter busanensis]KAA9332918.1 3-hydroxyacyl-CoA dehydrogenase [Hymenobacter busanensis]QHJ08408.1 3-hydroxyacyl-CoA dehydrogenase [Hymenobacter busanensis]
MHLLVLDGHHVAAELRQKFGPQHQYTFVPDADTRLVDDAEAAMQVLDDVLPTVDVVFDFGNYGPLYEEKEGVVVFVEGATESLASRFGGRNRPVYPVFGFCGLPTLINRPLLETSLLHAADADKLAETCAALGTDFRVVEDRVGLITPRVVCMIINEACYTLQEGTASVRDIDLGMKLGTNYPKGPFEWANAIGVARVYEVLEAMWQDTHDERYKICPLLKRMVQQEESFAL